MPTMGAFSGVPAIDPRYGAWPYAKTPPSADASQYPPPLLLEAIPTRGS